MGLAREVGKCLPRSVQKPGPCVSGVDAQALSDGLGDVLLLLEAKVLLDVVANVAAPLS
jgi:hypothetical protein